MLRTHTCGELRTRDINKIVTLCGWVQAIRDMGHLVWVVVRDRYGITQLAFTEGKTSLELLKTARSLGREYVVQVTGKVIERYSKNPKIPTGDIEIEVTSINILNESKLPLFTIEDETDGGEELRMKYRYLDLRRKPLKENMELRHKMAIETRNYLNSQNFIEIETPFLIKSTPEGARDFVVPSRVHQGEFYALPQSPQTFKQILMVAGFDRYYQIVRCFRDEDLRADRQPEFTQIDCEMAFIERDDILNMFEGLTKHLFKSVLNIEITDFSRISYEDAMKYYGTDKPDIRYEMKLVELTDLVKGKGFTIFDNAELIAGICVQGCANYSRKQIDELTEFVKKPQIGAKGLINVKYNPDGKFQSTIEKHFSQDDLKRIAEKLGAKAGDLILIIAGEKISTRYALSELRQEMGNRLGLRKQGEFAPLWVVDFPLLVWDKETQRFYATHHPFTSPKTEDISLLETNPSAVRANSYDLVINGVEIGGGSIRIHNKDLQKKMFNILGYTDEEAQQKFGFLMEALVYGAPPHGGIAFGFDRWCALFGGSESIRDFIAFPKNNAGRDIMINSPSPISQEQLKELGLRHIACEIKK